MKKVLAVILAGGRGKRMDILCLGRAKPSLPVAACFRVIDFSLSNCIHSGIDQIAVLTDYQRRPMADYLNHNAPWMPIHSDNLHLLEPLIGSYKGTADALYQNLKYLQKFDADRVLILAADHVYRMDYKKMLEQHEQVDADVTIGMILVPIEQANRFGIVTVNSEGRVTGFLEKPKIPTSNLASMGIYIFNKDVLIERLIEDAAQLSSPHDFGHAIIPGMVKRDKVFAYQFDGYWQDIGTIEAYYETNMWLLDNLYSFWFDNDWPVYTKDNNLLPMKVLQQDNIRHSLISSDSVIRGEVENSILSPGVRIEEKALVRNSIIMENTTVGKHSIVERCILDEDVTTGEFCLIGFGTSLVPGNWDITVLGKNVTVPPSTAIGRNCRIFPKVQPADFKENVVPSNTAIFHSHQLVEA
jgi:glucose-1-phosphate adenylyltransferase